MEIFVCFFFENTESGIGTEIPLLNFLLQCFNSDKLGPVLANLCSKTRSKGECFYSTFLQGGP